MNTDFAVTPEMIRERMDSWDARAWEEIKHLHNEYMGSLGDEATKSFKEFAVGIATQNVMFEMLSEEK